MKMQIRNTYRREDGRWVAYCVDDKSNPHIVSYPRILMAQKLGRPLEPNEDVHHIDGNPDNNSLDNLELQEHGEHQREHFQKYVDTTEICMICGKSFAMPAAKWARLYADLSRLEYTPRYLTCSRSCAAKAGSGYSLLYTLNLRLAEVEKLWLKQFGKQEQIDRNIYAEWVLNGETLPNGNTVPITQ